MLSLGLLHICLEENKLSACKRCHVRKNMSMLLAKSQFEACVEDIKNWMTTRLLKLNDDKTESILIQSRYVKPVSAHPLLVGEAEVDVSPSARNIGVIFDEYMSMDSHVTNVAKVSFISVILEE